MVCVIVTVQCMMMGDDSNGVHNGYVGGADSLLRVWPLDFEDFLVEARHEGPISCLAMTSSHVLGAHQARYMSYASISFMYSSIPFVSCSLLLFVLINSVFLVHYLCITCVWIGYLVCVY